MHLNGRRVCVPDEFFARAGTSPPDTPQRRWGPGGRGAGVEEDEDGAVPIEAEVLGAAVEILDPVSAAAPVVHLRHGVRRRSDTCSASHGTEFRAPTP